jgi:hypothetical protein
MSEQYQLLYMHTALQVLTTDDQTVATPTYAHDCICSATRLLPYHTCGLGVEHLLSTVLNVKRRTVSGSVQDTQKQRIYNPCVVLYAHQE